MLCKCNRKEMSSKEKIKSREIGEKSMNEGKISPVQKESKIGETHRYTISQRLIPAQSESYEFTTLNEAEGIYMGEVSHMYQKSGEGSFMWNNGNFYAGKWKSNEMNGNGVLYYWEGGILRGAFNTGKLEGYAQSEYANGDSFHGEWLTGSMHGKGVYYMSSSNQYLIANFEQGGMTKTLKRGSGKPVAFKVLHGKETLIEYSESQHFERYWGDVSNGERDGLGILYFSDGCFYHGLWKNNLPNGLGLFHYEDGKNNIGFFKDGLLNGYGRSQFMNGDYYEGLFYAGKMQGRGVYFQNKTQLWLFGQFIANKLIHTYEKHKVTNRIPSAHQIPSFEEMNSKFCMLDTVRDISATPKITRGRIIHESEKTEKKGEGIAGTPGLRISPISPSGALSSSRYMKSRNSGMGASKSMKESVGVPGDPSAEERAHSQLRMNSSGQRRLMGGRNSPGEGSRESMGSRECRESKGKAPTNRSMIFYNFNKEDGENKGDVLIQGGQVDPRGASSLSSRSQRSQRSQGEGSRRKREREYCLIF